MNNLRYTVKRGKSIGTMLKPHLHGDGRYVVSLTRFIKDYVRVEHASELPDWIDKGFSLRMSNPEQDSTRSPSLISPGAIERF